MTDSKSPSEADSEGSDERDDGDAQSSWFAGRASVRLIGALGLLLSLVLLSVIGIERLREDVFDAYQRLDPRTVDRYPARIVLIDETSLARFGPWPWPRFVMAELTDAILARGALAVGFDMIFAERDRHSAERFLSAYPQVPPAAAGLLDDLPDPDDAFAAVIGRSPVVLSRAGTDATDNGRDPADLPIEAVFTGDEPDGLLSFDGVTANVPDLSEVAAGIASINGPPDPDGIVRRVPLVVRIGGRLTPTLSVEVLRTAIGAESIGLSAPGGRLRSVTIGDVTVPVTADGRMRLHFSPPLAQRVIPAADVLARTVPDDAFENSIVLVATGAVGLGDVVSTPAAAASFGVDVHAQMVEAILSGGWLTRPDWATAVEWVLAAVLGLVAIGVLPLLRPSWALILALGGLVAIAGGSLAAFSFLRLLVDATVPAAVYGFAGFGTLGGILYETELRRRMLRDALVEERVQSAQIAGELAAARDIQMGMLPAPDDLAALPAAVELRARLEPARSVGGDLFDAVMLSENRLYFAVGDVTGKGVPASLFMALSKALSKSIMLRWEGDIDAAVNAVNDEVSRENTANQFLTALFGILDLESGEVAFCNAGHDNPFVVAADGAVSEFTMEGGPPLCALEGFPYPLETLRLAPGDMVVIITDGVTEARAPDGGMFGKERCFEVLRDAPPGAGPRDAVDRLIDAVRGFEAGGEPTDDLTVLALRYRGTEA